MNRWMLRTATAWTFLTSAAIGTVSGRSWLGFATCLLVAWAAPVAFIAVGMSVTRNALVTS
jgi:hypothetical protein